MWTSILSVIVVINELMASNAGSVMSPATNFDSWVEFYNPSDQAQDISLDFSTIDKEEMKAKITEAYEEYQQYQQE